MWYEDFMWLQVSESAAMEREYLDVYHKKEGYFIRVSYQAKVYDSGSEFGINGGRISKLSVYTLVGEDGDNAWERQFSLMNYDRGWDVEPSGEIAEKALSVILEKYKEAQ
jgi:hypothetical protein